MNTSQLKHFIDVVRFGSFVRAAKETKTSQPTLSRSVGLLEADLGVSLLSRSRTGLETTAEGRILFAESAELLEKLDGLKRKLSPTKEAPSLRIAASENLCIHVLPDFVRMALSRFPGAALELHSGTSEEIEERVSVGSANLGIFFNPPTRTGLVRKVLGEVEFKLVFPHGLSRAHLETLPFVGSRDSDYSKPYFAKRTLEKNGIKPKSIVRSNSQEAQVRMVGARVGYSVIPSFLAKAYSTKLSIDPKFSEFSKLYCVSRRGLEPGTENLLREILRKKEVIRIDKRGLRD